ncbi:MAG: hypothetical protein EXS14_08215 [Planctomycetes bacterium]|nr:hypothetical protein [Planctomycetota bacterium]
MLASETLLILQAAGLGALHALIPCAHSWPMLVPFLSRGQSATRVAWCFGLGMFPACAAMGLALGGLVPSLPEEWLHKAEEATGVVLVLIGMVLLWRTRAAHLGHLHGECEPEQDHGCAHRTHQPRRFSRLGPAAALFVLGFFNALVPCWTSLAAIALAAPAKEQHGALVVLLTFALSATLSMWIVLAVVRRGFRVLERLRSPTTEAWVLRSSGALLVFSGVSLLLHWHEHS